MIHKKPLYFFALIFLIACNAGNDKNSEKSASTQATDITKAKPGLNYKIDTSKQVTKLLVKRDTLLTINIKDNKGSVRAYLSGIGKHVTIIVPVAGGDSLEAEIIPVDNKANIRFNQIFIPVGKSGKYDGPFSKKIIYPITAKGNYKLIVGEDLMAESNWKGEFTCNIYIKNIH